MGIVAEFARYKAELVNRYWAVSGLTDTEMVASLWEHRIKMVGHVPCPFVHFFANVQGRRERPVDRRVVEHGMAVIGPLGTHRLAAAVETPLLYAIGVLTIVLAVLIKERIYSGR